MGKNLKISYENIGIRNYRRKLKMVGKICNKNQKGKTNRKGMRKIRQLVKVSENC